MQDSESLIYIPISNIFMETEHGIIARTISRLLYNQKFT